MKEFDSELLGMIKEVCFREKGRQRERRIEKEKEGERERGRVRGGSAELQYFMYFMPHA